MILGVIVIVALGMLATPVSAGEGDLIEVPGDELDDGTDFPGDQFFPGDGEGDEFVHISGLIDENANKRAINAVNDAAIPQPERGIVGEHGIVDPNLTK